MARGVYWLIWREFTNPTGTMTKSYLHGSPPEGWCFSWGGLRSARLFDTKREAQDFVRSTGRGSVERYNGPVWRESDTGVARVKAV